MTKSTQFRLLSLLFFTAQLAGLFAIYAYSKDVVVCTILTGAIIAGLLVWKFPKYGTSLVLVVSVLGWGVGQLRVNQVILGITANSYLFSVDDTGWTLAKLFGTSDPLLRYKTGPNRADRWETSFNHSNKISLLPGCLFRHGGHVWFFGVHHFLAMAFNLTVICAAYAPRALGSVAERRAA